MAELYTVSFAALSVLSVTTATCPASATAHSAMVLSMVLLYRFWVRLSTRSSLPERLYSTKRVLPAASAGRA